MYTPTMLGKTKDDIRGRLDRVEESISSASAYLKAMAVAVLLALAVAAFAFIGKD